MAELTDEGNKNTFLFSVKKYEQKEEHWFTVHIKLKEENNIFDQGDISFHINDFVELIKGVDSLTLNSNGNPFFVFEPTEPYLKLIFKLLNSQISLDIFLNKGPIFESSNYKIFNILTSSEKLLLFLKEIGTEFKKIDPKLEIKKVEL